MDVKKQVVTPEYAIYNTDNMRMLETLKENSIHMSVYSPPFATDRKNLYVYSSDDLDHSNCRTPDQFFDIYRFVVRELFRITKPGRMTCVHCMEVPGENNTLYPLPDEIRRIHLEEGWLYHAKYTVSKEPWRVALRTRAQGLQHRWIVEDSTTCKPAAPDEILVFRKPGENEIPVTHEHGLTRYYGANPPDESLKRMFANTTDQRKNRWSHQIWRKYANGIWDDIRIDNVLEFEAAKDVEDEKHVHPLQLDVVFRLVELYTNPGEICVTPYMGVGTEVYAPVACGRKGIGAELKDSYFRQAVRNLKDIKHIEFQPQLFDEDSFAPDFEVE